MKYIKTFILGYMIAVAWSLLATYLSNGLPHNWEISSTDWIHQWIPDLSKQALKEEILFHWLPLLSVSIAFPLLFSKGWVQGLLIIVLSIGFGCYGDHYFPVAFMSGLILGGVYIFALQRKRILHLDGLLIAFLVHLLHNITLVLIYCGGTFKGNGLLVFQADFFYTYYFQYRIALFTCNFYINLYSDDNVSTIFFIVSTFCRFNVSAL